MADGDDDFDELENGTKEQAKEFLEVNIEMKAKEIQVIKNQTGDLYKGRAKFK